MMAVRLGLLKALSLVFPPEPTAQMGGQQSTERELVKAAGSMGDYLQRLGRHDVDVLDYGCGWGGETLWLAERVRSAVGFDVEATSIADANRALASMGVPNCRFVCDGNGLIPLGEATVDAVFSTDTFEHVMDLDRAFGEIARVLRPGGRLITRFGPLFHSPFGYHLRWACQVPWAHVIFGLAPIVQLRNERAGTVLEARSWADTGLNGRRFHEFQAALKRSGLEPLRFERVAVHGLTRLAAAPVVGDYFTFGIDCEARKP
jgi:SAM-dependent methyltransferase